jgi:beta-glucanase (GH16 family)
MFLDGWMGGWMDGWMDGWVDGRVGVKAVLRIAYSNQKSLFESDKGLYF